MMPKHPKYTCEDLRNSQCYRLHIPLNYTYKLSNIIKSSSYYLSNLSLEQMLLLNVYQFFFF